MIENANDKAKKKKPPEVSERELNKAIEDSSKFSPLETGECPVCSIYIADK